MNLYESITSSFKNKDDKNYEEWKAICEVFCKKIGAELLFVNSDNFGYMTKDGQTVHMCADELAEYLKAHPLKESNKRKTFKYNNTECWMKIGTYSQSPIVLAIEFMCSDGPYTTATVNLGEDVGNNSVMPFGASFLDTNNNSDIDNFFKKLGLGEVYTRFGEEVTAQSGFCSYPLFQFDINKLKEYDPEGFATYESSYKANLEKARNKIIDEAEYGTRLNMNLYENIKSNNSLPLSYAKENDIRELDELGKLVDPKVKDIIDRFTSSEERTALYGNRAYFYSMFKTKDFAKDDRESIKKDINEAFDDSIKNNIIAISHQFFPYDRELGFLIAYKNNILEICVYNSGAYTSSYIPEVMINNAFGDSRSTFFRKNLSNNTLVNSKDIEKCLLPLPEDTLTPKIDQCRHILFKPEQLSLDLSESSSSDQNIQKYINELNELRKNYHFHYGDTQSKAEDAKIEKRIIEILNEIPDGTILYQNYKDRVSGYTSFGGYNHEYAKILEYKKEGNQWRGPHGLKDVNDMKLSVLHNSSDMKTKEQAEKGQEEMKKDLHSSRTSYAPSSQRSDNPFWDGNKYGI